MIYLFIYLFILVLHMEKQKVWNVKEEVRGQAKYVCLGDEEQFGISKPERIYFRI